MPSLILRDVSYQFPSDTQMSEGAEDWEHHSDASSSTYDCLTPSTTMSEGDPTRENDGETPTEDISKAEVNEAPHKDTSKEKEKKTPSKDTSKGKDKKTPSKDTSKEKEKKISPKATSKEEESITENNPANHIEHHPIPGESFMIRTRQEPRRILTLISGQLKFLEKPIPGGGAFWHCHKKGNWHGFRNTVSGTYLGQNGDNTVLATKNRHEITESFGYFRREGGGYVLLTPHGKEQLQVAISGDGKSLVEQEEGGEAWDFIALKHFETPVRLKHPNGTVEELR